MNTLRYILVAVLVLASAFSISAQAPVVEHRGHVMELSGLPIPNLSGCNVQSFEVTAKSAFWAVYCTDKKAGFVTRHVRPEGTVTTLNSGQLGGDVLGLRVTPKGVSFVAYCNLRTPCSAWSWEPTLQKTAETNEVVELVTSGDRRTTKAKLLQVSPDYYGSDGRIYNNVQYQLQDTGGVRLVIMQKGQPSTELIIQSSLFDEGINVTQDFLVYRDLFGVRALDRKNSSVVKTLFSGSGTFDGENILGFTFGYDRSNGESIGSYVNSAIQGRLVRFDPNKGTIVLTKNDSGTISFPKADNGRFVYRARDRVFAFDGQTASPVIIAGDELFGKKITETGQNAYMDFATIQGCDIHFVDIANSRSLVAHDPCITSSTRNNKDGSVTIKGDNFQFPGFNPRIQSDDGVVVIPDSVSKTEITFTPTGLFGERQLRVAMGSNVLSNMVKMSFDTPPSPTIVSFSCSSTLVTSGDAVSCSWETLGGSVTINGETVDARGSRTFTVRNFLPLTLVVTGTDGTETSSLQDLRVLPMFLSGIECDFTVSPSPCKFSGVGFTGQSSVRLVAINDGVEEPVGIFPVILDEILENITFEIPQTLGPGSYKIFGQTPGEGIGGMQTFETDASLEIIIPEPAPPNSGNNSKKEVR